ncbi:MAG TPA: adenylate cyclase, partial [Zunongwangia profunda]|nr:adenylate cyclase [Zunongwangia profunda]
KQLLTISNGILTIVDKKREIYFIDNVKFQLDTVKDLGTFIEIEATDVNKNKSKEDLLNQCEFYMELFKLSESDLISVSYSDLILEKTKPVYNNASYEKP